MTLSSRLLSLHLGFPQPANAADMVFTSWGGTTQDAQKAAWADRSRRKTGINVLQDGPTDYGKIKAMVEAGSVTWDVVDVEGDYAVQAGKAGLLEKLDFSVIDKSKLDPRFVTDYSVGSFYYSFVIGCNKDAVSACPKTWADLFDSTKFPGKRTFYKWSAPGVIEAALAGRRRSAGQALSARSRPRLQEARHHQGRHHLVDRQARSRSSFSLRPKRRSVRSGTAA